LSSADHVPFATACRLCIEGPASDANLEIMGTSSIGFGMSESAGVSRGVAETDAGVVEPGADLRGFLARLAGLGSASWHVH
jgi:hypothetical protein